MTGGHGTTLYVVASPSGAGPARKSYRVYDAIGPVSEDLAAFDPQARAIQVKPRPSREQPPGPAATMRGTTGLPARPFDRLFGEHSGRFQDPDLDVLGSAMVRPGGADDVSTVPAGFTYLGQLIFHDITWMDPSSPSLNKVSSQLDFKSIIENAEPDTSPDGPLAIGSTLPFPYRAMRQDLPRVRAGADVGRPLIADARNDSFLPLAQMHLLFLMFFNAVARHCGYGTESYDPKRAMRLYVLHAQHVVLDDYLRLIIDPGVYADVIENGRRFISPGAADLLDFDVSIEFAAAVGRFGHAMIRSEYVPWNSAQQTANLFFFMKYSHRNREQDRPMHAIDSDWVTSWPHLFEFPDRPLPLCAARIGPQLANPLGKLPERIRHTGDGEPPNTDFNLAQATLKRQSSLGLAPAEAAIEIINASLGQDDAIVPLSPDELAAGLPADAAALFAEGGQLRGCTPLWFYTLREAALRGGGDRLGPFGSRVTMETLHACIEKSDISILKERGWVPELCCHGSGRFTITDLIRFTTDLDPLKRWTGSASNPTR